LKSLYLVFLFFFTTSIYARDIAHLAKELNLYGGTKAKIQWERVFSSQRHLVKYGLDQLPLKKREELKKYLLKHAADSKQPIVPGL